MLFLFFFYRVNQTKRLSAGLVELVWIQINWNRILEALDLHTKKKTSDPRHYCNFQNSLLLIHENQYPVEYLPYSFSNDKRPLNKIYLNEIRKQENTTGQFKFRSGKKNFFISKNKCSGLFAIKDDNDDEEWILFLLVLIIYFWFLSWLLTMGHIFFSLHVQYGHDDI